MSQKLLTLYSLNVHKPKGNNPIMTIKPNMSKTSFSEKRNSLFLLEMNSPVFQKPLA